MIKWLIFFLIPFFILTIVAVVDKDFRPYFPSFEVLECLRTDKNHTQVYYSDIYKKHLYVSIETYLLVNFTTDLALIIFIYNLRHVQDEFSINFELKCISLIWITLGFLMFYFIIIHPDPEIIKSNSINYFMITRGLLCLIVTAILPIRRSYHPNSIIPFPINEECIKSLEMALLMPTSANYFYDYLENSCENKEALIYFGLYADIRTYIRLFEEGDDGLEIRKQAE